MKKFTIRIPEWLVSIVIHLIIIYSLMTVYNSPIWINNKIEDLKFIKTFSDIIILILIMFTTFNFLNYMYKIIKSIILDSKPIQFYELNIKLPKLIKKESNVGKYKWP